MSLRFNTTVDLGHIATAVMAMLVVGAGWLSQHDQLQKHEDRIAALEQRMTARELADDAFRNEMRSDLHDILDQVNKISVAMVNKQDRR